MNNKGVITRGMAILAALILIIIIKPVKKNNEDIYSKYLYPNGKDYLLRR